MCVQRSNAHRPLSRRTWSYLVIFRGPWMVWKRQRIPAKPNISPAQLPNSKNLRLTGIRADWQVARPAQPPSLASQDDTISVTESIKRWNYQMPWVILWANPKRWKDWKNWFPRWCKWCWGVIYIILSPAKLSDTDVHLLANMLPVIPQRVALSVPLNHGCDMLWYNPMSVASYQISVAS